MSIPNNEEIGKSNGEIDSRFKSRFFDWLFVVILIILVIVLAGGIVLFFKYGRNNPPIQIEYNHEVATVSQPAATSIQPLTATSTQSQSGNYVASRAGEAYYLPWCPGAKRIAEKNKIWFATKEAAEKAGYRPAEHCPGLK